MTGDCIVGEKQYWDWWKQFSANDNCQYNPRAHASAKASGSAGVSMLGQNSQK